MGGEPYPAGTLQAGFLRDHPLLLAFGHLAAKGFLVALAQGPVRMERHIAADIDAAAPYRTHVLVLIHLYQIVAGQHHDAHLGNKVQEHLVAMENNDIVGKTEIV